MRTRATKLIGCGSGRISWTPAKLTTSLWLDAADASTVTLNGSTVSQWADKSGNGANALQATAANQPAWGVSQNLLVYSEQIGAAGWSVIDVTIASNQIASPIGTLTADKLQENTNTSFHMVRQTASFAATTQYTASAYFKKAERDIVYLNAFVGGVGGVVLYANLTTGVVAQTSASAWTINSTAVTLVTDGWYRVSITFTTTTAAAGIIDFALTSAAGTSQYAGTSGFGAYMWGAQLQQGTLNPYQKTESAAQSLIAGINGKPSMAWPYVFNTREFRTTATVVFQDVYIVAQYADGAQATWIGAPYQGLFGDAVTRANIGLIGNTIGTNTWYDQATTFLAFRKNGGASQNLSSVVQALPLPAAIINSTNSAAAITNPISVGTDRDLGAAGRGWLGQIGEFIALPTTADADTRQKLEGYLAWKWSLVGSLPADHPYKLFPPTA